MNLKILNQKIVSNELSPLYLNFQLVGGFDNYLNPEENDISLIKSYNQALNGNLLRKGSVPYLIASHHVEKFKQRRMVNKS